MFYTNTCSPVKAFLSNDRLPLGGEALDQRDGVLGTRERRDLIPEALGGGTTLVLAT